MDKAVLIKGIKDFKSLCGRNSMGCSENWYDFFYAMKETFSIQEIENMSDREIDLLEKLFDNVAEGLY